MAVAARGDLGGGKFDGANLVANFENLNPANTLWKKWYHLYANIDTEPPRFLEFERWWGGFYLFNEEEIRWIVNNLFVGNKLSSGEARLGPGRYFDLKAIKQPIIVFASMGDNITPPQQAFNWIADVYRSSEEIKANGQTIVGAAARGRRPPRHLRVGPGRQEGARADRRGAEVHPGAAAGPVRHAASTRTPQADGEMAYEVTLSERKVEDLRRLQKYDRVDERPFQAVAALSELIERAYSLLVRPFVRDADAGVVRQGDARLPSAAHAVLGALGQESVAVARCRSMAAVGHGAPPARSDDNDFVQGWRSSRRRARAHRSTSTATCATRATRRRSSRCTAT